MAIPDRNGSSHQNKRLDCCVAPRLRQLHTVAAVSITAAAAAAAAAVAAEAAVTGAAARGELKPKLKLQQRDHRRRLVLQRAIDTVLLYRHGSFSTRRSGNNSDAKQEQKQKKVKEQEGDHAVSTS